MESGTSEQAHLSVAPSCGHLNLVWNLTEPVHDSGATIFQTLVEVETVLHSEIPPGRLILPECVRARRAGRRSQS